MNTTIINLDAMNLTEKTLNTLRDERLDTLRSQLNNACEEFANIEQSIIDFHTPHSFSEHITTWTRIKLNLESYYREQYKYKLFPRFVPFERSKLHLNTDASAVQRFYTFDKKYLLRDWNNQWYVLPIFMGDPIRGIITVTTPEELRMNKIEVKGYSNPFLAMLGFYCDLVEEVQHVHGELRPRCDAENCPHYMMDGRCRYQDLRKPDPDSCILGIQRKEVK